MKIEILGTGCPKCKKLTKNAEEALKEVDVDGEIVKVTDINKITEYGVMVTPGLAIDGDVKTTGKVLSKDKIKDLLT
ncbi:MAG: thioredoxin family protein [Elusimicrobiota bacterium]